MQWWWLRRWESGGAAAPLCRTPLRAAGSVLEDRTDAAVHLRRVCVCVRERERVYVYVWVCRVQSEVRSGRSESCAHHLRSAHHIPY